MKLYTFCITFMLSLLSCFGQETHIIEPSMLEICYHTKYLNSYDDYALRIGKNVSEYFSYPLAELSQCILDSSNGSIINVI